MTDPARRLPLALLAMTAVAAMITVAIAFICWTKAALACGVIVREKPRR